MIIQKARHFFPRYQNLRKKEFKSRYLGSNDYFLYRNVQGYRCSFRFDGERVHIESQTEYVNQSRIAISKLEDVCLDGVWDGKTGYVHDCYNYHGSIEHLPFEYRLMLMKNSVIPHLPVYIKFVETPTSEEFLWTEDGFCVKPMSSDYTCEGKVWKRFHEDPFFSAFVSRPLQDDSILSMIRGGEVVDIGRLPDQQADLFSVFDVKFPTLLGRLTLASWWFPRPDKLFQYCT